VNIGLSALFILVTLFLLGGQTLGDFALALVVGVVTGIYSSVMVASPIAVLLERWKPSVSVRPVKVRQEAKVARPAKAKVATATAIGEGLEGDEEVAPRVSTNRPAPRPRKKSKKKR